MFIGTKFVSVRDKGFTSKATSQPTDDIYQSTKRYFVIGTADIICLVGGKMLLGKRQKADSACYGKEMYFGGHMIPGENPLQTARRELREEIGINVEPLRFIPFDLVCEIREKGFCCTSFIYLVFLQKDEMGNIQLNDEFNGSILLSPKEIIKNASDYDELVVRAAKNLRRFKWLYHLIYLYKKFFKRSGD